MLLGAPGGYSPFPGSLETFPRISRGGNSSASVLPRTVAASHTGGRMGWCDPETGPARKALLSSVTGCLVEAAPRWTRLSHIPIVTGSLHGLNIGNKASRHTIKSSLVSCLPRQTAVFRKKLQLIRAAACNTFVRVSPLRSLAFWWGWVARMLKSVSDIGVRVCKTLRTTRLSGSV